MAMTFGGYPPPPLHKSTHTTGGIDALSASDIGAQPSAYTIVSISSNLLNGDKVALDTTSAALTSTLPSAPVNGDTIYILDYAGTFDSNNLTIARNGNNIESLAEDLVCNVQKAAFSLVYAGSTVGWKVVPQTSQMPSTQLANTWQVNQTFNGTNNVAPNQTAASGSSILTRDLGDARYPRVMVAVLDTNFNGDQNTTTYKDIPTLSFSLQVGTYYIEALLVHDGNASYASSGVKDRIDFTGTASAVGTVYRALDNAATASSAPNSLVSANVIVESAPTNRSQTTLRRGVLTVTSSGTLTVQIAQAIATAAANTTLRQGSYLKVTLL